MITVYDFVDIGTHKSIGVDEIIHHAISKGADTISMISSGNYLDALLREIKKTGFDLRVVNLINHAPNSDLELEIEDNRILVDSIDREEYVAERVPGAGKVMDVTDFIPNAYDELTEQMLASEPNNLSLGIGTGKLFVSLYRKIKEKGLSTRLIGVVPEKANGIFNDDNLYEKGEDTYFREFDGSVADKLATPYTFFKDEIDEAIGDGHLVVEATEEDLLAANREAKSKGHKAEVSGSAGFVVCDKRVMELYGIEDDQNILVVNTGSGTPAMPWYSRALRPAAALVASVAIAIGASMYFNKEDSSFEQWARQELSQLSQNPILRYVAGDRELNELTADELSRVITLQSMDSNGQDFLNYSRELEKLADYQRMCRFRSEGSARTLAG